MQCSNHEELGKPGEDSVKEIKRRDYFTGKENEAWVICSGFRVMEVISGLSENYFSGVI